MGKETKRKRGSPNSRKRALPKSPSNPKSIATRRPFIGDTGSKTARVGGPISGRNNPMQALKMMGSDVKMRSSLKKIRNRGK